MKLFLFLLMTIFTTCSFGQDKCELDHSASDYIVSGDGKSIILFDKKRSCLGVFQNGDSRTKFFPKLKNITDINPDVNFSISKNSMYILMQFNESEYDHVIRVYSLKDLSLIVETNASVGIWVENNLVLVPNYQLEDLPKPQGLRVFETQSKLEKIIAKNFAFTGKIAGGGNRVVGDVLIEQDEVFVTKQLVFDINTGEQLKQFKINNSQ